MALRLPQEVVVEQVLPTLRAMLARELHDRGLTQEAVADHLGVTQGAVSRYVTGEPELEGPVAEDPRTVETVERVADGLADGSMGPHEALSAVLELVRALEDRGPVCELHEAAMPALQGLGCDLCVRGPDDALRAERDALASVRTAARRLAGAPGVAAFVPNVGTNVGEALPGATDETDVAAVPGRLIAMRGRVEVPANPEFGASRHVAGLVLAAASVDPAVRGALNLATDDRLLEAARERGLAVLEFDPEYEDRGAHLRERFEAAGVPDLAYHRGSYGVEPVTYVLGASAVAAAELAVDLVAAVAD